MQRIQIRSGTIVATLLGLVAAGIVWATLAGVPIPLLGSDRAALVALVVVGFAMCVTSGWGATGEIPAGPTTVIAALAGMFSLVVLGAVIFGWTAILDPLAGVIYGTGASSVTDKVGVVTVGALIAVAWLTATLRQIGVFSTATG